MGRRTREHVLEDQSRRELRSALPMEWVIRDQDQDYGIDLQIEPYEKSGNPACPVFLAQLKATDKAETSKKSASIRLQMNLFREYVAGPLPVLLVAYNSSTGRLMFDWAHRVGQSLPDVVQPRWDDRKTITIKLKNNLRKTAPAILVEQVRQFFRHRGGVREVPNVRVSLNSEQQTSLVQSAFENIAVLLGTTGGRTQISHGTGDIDLVLRSDMSVVRVRYTELDLELPTFLSPTATLEDVTGVLLATVAIMLSVAGLSREGSMLLTQVVNLFATTESAVSLLLAEPRVWLAVTSERPEVLLESARILAGRGLDLQALLAAFSARTKRRSVGDSVLLEQQYRDVLKSLLSGAEGIRQGMLHFNIANSLRVSGYARAAVENYLKAAIALPKYLNFPYWWSETAAALFLSGRRRLSVCFYRYAIELGQDRFDVGLLADVLMDLRRFEEAQSYFDKWLKDNSELNAELVLKALAISVLAHEFGSGTRQIARASRIVDTAWTTDDRAIQLVRLRTALSVDPLCFGAWRNFAALSSKQSPESTMDWWICAAALTGREDVNTLVHAVVILSNPQGDLSDAQLNHVRALAQSAAVYLGHSIHGERFYFELARIVRPKDPKATVDDLLSHFRNLAEKSAIYFETRSGFVARFFDFWKE